jgi:tetraacyldisaccharide 4'-kinase
MHAWIRNAWERKGIGGKALWLLLLPASYLYGLMVLIRNLFFSRGWVRTSTLEKPVISIGNLTVGGTGKTPSCLWLARELNARGFKVGILSRGYPRKETQPLIIGIGTNGLPPSQLRDEASAAGDEPSMMARIYNQTVGVGKDRYQTAVELLRKHDVDVFILDDGYQHRRLNRDVDLLLLGHDSNGCMLPSGPFREPRRALRRADFFLLTGGQEEWQAMLPEEGKARCFAGTLRGVALVGFESGRWKEYPLSVLHGSKILAVTGIADPSEFYRVIGEWEGDVIDALPFPDHHSYSSRDWQEISRLARNAEIVLTTEKDILKLIAFPFARGKLFALRVAMTVENGERLVQCIVEKIRDKTRALRTA